ncbi:hypothetical protein [Crassaminicella profunda]|nr:hypothetical protein [Crassaminicella profunda]
MADALCGGNYDGCGGCKTELLFFFLLLVLLLCNCGGYGSCGC